jgi:tetratricopeptide (TPR) repeat protein
MPTISMRPVLFPFLALLSGCGMACEGGSTTNTCTCNSQTVPADSAIASCSTLLDDPALSPEQRANALQWRSWAYRRGGDAARTMQDIDAYLKLRPDSVDAYVFRGVLHGEKGDYADSILDSERALKLDPRSVTAMRNLGKAQSDSGDHVHAMQVYQQALALAPDDAPLVGALCWERAALGIELEAALAGCTRAIERAPGDANHFNSRGFVRFRLGDNTGSIHDYDRAIAMSPNVASSYYMRGRAKARLGDASASADIARGLAGEPGIAARYATYGVQPD